MTDMMPPEIAALLEQNRRDKKRGRSRHLVVAGDRQHRILEFTRDGFVIEADGRPPLRGFVDVMAGEERISRRLVVCAWAEDGLVGYEFKRASSDGDERHAADYVEPGLAGLLPRPDP